ncbi:glycosyltransferase [Paenibacillus sp. HW567]|uniref:glycosyltransferase n=1 Tax=Paenibacillus sp. HW567 TaxID=1034769 RepID=UPI00036D5920|nr:glycosyltransferase [Paenibacillus sp. HW567]
MKKIIFVNNPAATSGGALTILKQFIQQVAQENENFYFYIFCSYDLSAYERDNIKIIILNNNKKWKNRIYWDFVGLKKWSLQNNVVPSIIISLQNTGVYNFGGIEQVIYLHQPFPYYYEYKWKFSKKEERIYWFYKNIYKHLIQFSINRKTHIVVQSNWLKKRVSKMHNVDLNKIYVIKPHIEIPEEKVENKNVESYLFFPASGLQYKNHDILIRALSIIKQEYKKKIFLVLTLASESQYSNKLFELARELDVKDQVSFVGNLSYEEVFNYYKECNLVVFPSYLETFGLPLIEAASFKKPIVASDLEYAKEALEGYAGVKFAQHNSPQDWAEAILNQLVDCQECSYQRKIDIRVVDQWNKIFETMLH